jgi:hypothetical protein
MIASPTVSCSFKLAYESLTKTYGINRNIPRGEFINIFHTCIARDFNLSSCYIVDTDYSIQNTDYRGNMEDSPPISINSLYDKISQTNHNNSLAFYIKPAESTSTHNDDLVVQLSVPPVETSSPVETPEEPARNGCLLCETENCPTINYYGCSHILCQDCIVGCLRSAITRCPFCRNPL